MAMGCDDLRFSIGGLLVPVDSPSLAFALHSSAGKPSMTRRLFSVFLSTVLSACSPTTPAPSYQVVEAVQAPRTDVGPRDSPLARQVSPNPTASPTSGTVDARSSCFDVDASEPRTLTGRLEWVMFPGPPNYEDVQRGDSPEPAFILKLEKGICVFNESGSADPNVVFDTVHVVVGKKVSWQDLKDVIGKSVTLKLYGQVAAHTGHHHAPLVAWVASISAADPSRQLVGSSTDPTMEYGTAATTIRAFYSALHAGQGDVAASMIVSEKTVTGSLSATSLSQFYGNLKTPIELINVSVLRSDT